MIRYRLPRGAVRGAIIGAALAVAGCTSSPTIKTDYDQTVDFSRFHSYVWALNAAPRGMNPLLFQRVQASIDRSLATRGFTPAAAGSSGDFAVAFTLGRRDSVQVTDLGPYGPFYRGWGWAGARNVDVRNITDGTIVIDIYDVATRQAVWHGVATQQINPDRIDQAQVDTAIDSILARFPPQPGG